MNLYKVENENIIRKLISDSDNENLAFDELPGTFDEKIVWIAKDYKNLEAEYYAVNAAMRDMKKRLEYIESLMDDSERFIKNRILGSGLLDPIKTKDFVIKVQFNRPSVIITAPELIPDIYKVTQEIVSFDLNQINKDITDGFEIDGAELKRKTKLVIK